VLTCPTCGRENPDGFEFCGYCRSPLGARETPATEVRKTVTVVFCDVTGSTSLGEQLDPESMRKVMSRFFEEMRVVLERHGGTVEKFIGDAVMAVFGIPSVHEDDALRFMGYCSSIWVSPHTYAGLRAGMMERFGEPSSARQAGDARPETLFLNFRVHRVGTVEVLPSFHLPKASDPIDEGPLSEISCELVDRDGKVLVFRRCRQGEPHQEADAPFVDFHEAIPWFD
jgi:hypothetical protein